MNETGPELRAQVRDELTSRAWYIDSLAAHLGISPGRCVVIAGQLRDNYGLPVVHRDDGMYCISFPKGRRCETCGCILSTYNPSVVCNAHGGGAYTEDEVVEPKPSHH